MGISSQDIVNAFATGLIGEVDLLGSQLRNARPGATHRDWGNDSAVVENSGPVVDDPSTLIEAQAGNGLVVRMAVLYLLEGAPTEPGKVVSPHTIFFTGCEGVRAHRVCKPGDILSLSIKPKRMKMPLMQNLQL